MRERESNLLDTSNVSRYVFNRYWILYCQAMALAFNSSFVDQNTAISSKAFERG